jgi:2-methylcitrate dehydratase PrpD
MAKPLNSDLGLARLFVFETCVDERGHCMDAIYEFSRNILNTTYEHLPSKTVDATKKLIIDSMAVALGGSAKGGVRELADLLAELGGREESSVWVYGGKLPCIGAAQVNATMIHALDYDDTHDAANFHAGVASVPVALAVAQRLGGIDGKKLITAVALGVDFAARLCLANTTSMFERGWHYTTLHGNFNAAAVAGKLLELDLETLVSAFGLAYHQAGGNLQGLHDGTLAKRIGPGFSARNGIMAVLMAQRGITGPKNVLQGRHGLFNVYHRGEYNPRVLNADLGERFEVANLSYKPYPCCRHNHGAVDATLALVQEHKLTAQDVDTVRVYLSKGCMTVVGEPLDKKQSPATVVDAQFSAPWSVASAIVHNKLGIAQYTSEAIADKEVLILSNAVTPLHEASLDRLGVGPTVVEIRTRDGKVYSKRVDAPYGSPENPMSIDSIAAKLRDCASYAAKPLSQENLEKLLEMVGRIETVKDVGQIVGLL